MSSQRYSSLLETVPVLYAMNVSWIFCFTFLLLIHTVSVQSVRVEGFIGESVILPCLFGQKPQTVYWRYKDNRVLCHIIGGEADFNEQDPVYKDRVKIFPSAIEKGDFSIMLSNLNESDAGLYTCTCNDPINPLTLKLELTVTANGDSPRRADGLLTFLLGCALLYSLTF